MNEDSDRPSPRKEHYRMAFGEFLRDGARDHAKGDYPRARTNYYLAGKIAKRLGEAEEHQARYGVLHVDGDIYRAQRHNPWQALRFYRQALQLTGPNDITIHQMMAVCYSMVHHHKDAEWWLGEALCQLTSDQPQLRGAILRDLGKAQSEQGHYDHADASFEASLELLTGSERGATHHFWGMSYFRRGEADKALEHFERAFELTTGAYRLYALLNHAMVLIAFGQRTDANLLLDEAALLATEHGSWVHRLRIKALRRGIVGTWAWQAAQPALQWSQRGVAAVRSLTSS